MTFNLGSIYLAHSQPEDVAIMIDSQSITYGTLHQNVRQFAAFLSNRGIGKADVVALSCPNSAEFIYAYLAAVQLGAIVVPLNLMLTLEELFYIISDCKPKLIIIHEKIAERLGDKLALIPEKQQLILNQELMQRVAGTTVNEAVFPELDLNSVCSLLYTSGTTGKPKGAMITHHNLISNVSTCSKTIDMTKEDRIITVLPMFHSLGWSVCVLMPLYTGAKLMIHRSFQPKEILQSIIINELTIFVGVPSMFAVLAQALRGGEEVRFPTLRLALSGGSPLPSEFIKTFKELLRIPIMEGYGLSETSPVVSFNPMIGEKKPGSVGIAIEGVAVAIMNEWGQELRALEIGEIAVRGPNVMQGYLNLPEASAEVLKNGYFHTGDLGYKDEEGYIYIVDRIKDMIMVSGEKVYSREVEDVLYAHPSILEAAVIGVLNKTKGEDVKAIVVLKENCSLQQSELAEFFRERLSAYKRPKIIEFVDTLPKNATGKIMKKDLRAKASK
jgi:long-chain acyl-CoA synthetase